MDKKIERLLNLYNSGRIGLCTLISHVIGPKGEELYIVQNLDNEALMELVRLADDFNTGNIACLENYLIMLSEAGDKYILLALAKLIKSLGLELTRKYLDKFSRSGFIDIERGLKEIFTEINLFSDDALGGLLIILVNSVSPNKLEIIARHLSQRKTDTAKQFLEMYETIRAPEEEVKNIIKSISLKIQNCISSRNRKCILRQLSVLHISIYRFGKDSVVKYLSEGILGTSTVKRIINMINPSLIDALEAQALVSFMDLFADKMNMDILLGVSEGLILEKLYDNLDVLADITLRGEIHNKKILLQKISSVRKSDNVLLREFYATLLSKFVEEGETWALRFLRVFCRDKRSPIRAKCAHAILDYFRKVEKIDMKLVKALISSKNTKALVGLLDLIRDFDVDQDTLNYVVRVSSKVPRSSVAESLLNILEKNWNKIDRKILLTAIKRIYALSSRKKNLREKLLSLVSYIVENVEDSELKSQLSFGELTSSYG